ncbi:beta-glucosidase [Dyadobacter jejuensis]|uniref:Beta-glucosidase n=1 Tax=Dyadobacter jejuensis TaxID=1082580 RepID=A0A316AHP3_9BACT|nr:GH1 family beta-glucosidase [Dyadobacter jejuensis]PWJ57226.1 beta-glucosidase [Dyadobacter jejuensis]
MSYRFDIPFDKSEFGEDFLWGTATAAYQIEGATDEHGRGPCIWDEFVKKKGKIKDGSTADLACDFYNRFEEDLQQVVKLGLKHFRFSISWSRLLPEGVGEVNQEGIDFYNRILDACQDLGIEPWLTLYHWDLPLALEQRGGWKNREVVDWFAAYTQVCIDAFGARVRNWIVMNEPMATAGLGYTTGLHAPGRMGLFNFLPVVHHLALCQAEAGRLVRNGVADANIGTALSCSAVRPLTDTPKDLRAASRADAVMNRLFIEPALGLGYPSDVFPYLANIKKYMLPGDDDKLKFDFDFIGLQNYFSVVVTHSYLRPILWLKEIPALERKKPITAMGWEIAPDGMFDILRQFANYPNLPPIIISENGAAFEDKLVDGSVADVERTAFFREYLAAILKAKRQGVQVKGYFAWTLMDNFEWAVGYTARFGLIYVDFDTQERIWKDSAKWFAQFLGAEEENAVVLQPKHSAPRLSK